jgi:hypothetical protein
MGLLPLFEPYSEIGGVSSRLDKDTLSRIHTLEANGKDELPATNLTTIPEVQVFTATSLAGDAGLPQHMQTIVAQEAYRGFSLEVNLIADYAYS